MGSLPPLAYVTTKTFPHDFRELDVSVLDTGMSLALGFPTHALFNLAFGIALAPPLMKLRSS